MSAHEREKLIKKSLNTFLLIFLCLGALLGGMILVFYQMQTENYIDRLTAEEQYSVSLQREVVRNYFATLVSDLLFLAEQEELKAYQQNPSGRHLDLINSEYLAFSANKKYYDQIRYLNKHGMEVARVNYNGGQPARVAKDKLQSKQKRYYFKDAFRLNKGEVFVSPLDLNIESGKVEEPYKPMIRFGTPVYDQAGVKQGIVLLNYLGNNILELIQDVGSVARGQTMLFNADGYWLQHPDSSKAWGFMFAEKAHLNLAVQQPEIWQQMRADVAGQISTAQGIYTYATIYPLGAQYVSSSGSSTAFGASTGVVKSDEYFWKIVSFISTDTLSSYSKGLLANLFILGAGLFLLAAIAAWFLAMAITRRKLYQAQLFSMAHYDNLTGLPNRTLFFDRLTQSLQLAKRHDRMCALLYVDLDGFKYVNDSFGHDAGDELLVAVGERMGTSCRDSDTVARMGGDEFAILLTEVSDAEGAQALTEKILAGFEEPFILKQGEARVGASIGIGMFPAHGTTLDQLLRNADKAMYLSKSRGKNTYTFAEE